MKNAQEIRGEIYAILARAAKLRADTSDPVGKAYYATIAEATRYLRDRIDEFEANRSPDSK